MKDDRTTQTDWPALLDRFSVPGHSGIYVLGCFARYLTLYSQQVRALNLITALLQTKALRAGMSVAIVGGGAAGLTAAAAAAYKGASVTLFEQLEGPMELQRNNRQRWLHPRIYDWPEPGWENDKADLPLITWNAGYGENVALQIERYWKRLQEDLGIKTKWLSTVTITRRNDTNILIWQEQGKPGKRDVFDLIVLAVGFGLEPESEGQRSYWDEDDLDGTFRRRTDKPKKWLISGCGDGGLTDLMRLCLRRFRHEEIARLFATASGIDGTIKELGRIHAHEKCNDPEFLSDQFEKLEVEGLSQLLKDRFRRSGSTICLAAESPFYYGPASSVLNRLIVSQLYRIPAFEYRLGPIESVAPKPGGGYEVTFKDGRKEHFDRVILRYGPKPAALEEAFPNLWAACEPKRKDWRLLSRTDDKTAKRLWEPNFFGPEPAAPLAGDARAIPSPVTTADRIGVRAKTLSLYKEVRNDGSSSVTYRIEGLAVTDPSLRLEGLRFYFGSDTGRVGEPEFDENANRLGITWDDPDSQERQLHPLDQTRTCVRRLYGVLKFKSALTKDDQPLSFGFRVNLLNGDALSKWEFDHLYSEEERTQFNGDPVDPSSPKEYFARVVWFPVETLKMEITLPERISADPSVSRFVCPDADLIPRDEIVHDSILESYPSAASAWHPRRGTKKWKRSQEADGPIVGLTEHSLRTWQLKVQNAVVGSCYAIDWLLPTREGDASFQLLESQAAELRLSFLSHRESRLRGDPGDADIARSFRWLDESVRGFFKPAEKEGFEVSLMVFDDVKRRLVVVEGAIDGSEPTPKLWDFSLPFGLGLAGACFKEGERAFLYVRPEEPSPGPELYIPGDDDNSHDVLLALPIDHPQFAKYLNMKGLNGEKPERARQCIGVINIGSKSRTTNLGNIRTDTSVIPAVIDLCQNFANRAMISKL